MAVAFCAGMLDAMSVLAVVFMDVTCPGVAPCSILVMGLPDQTTAILTLPWIAYPITEIMNWLAWAEPQARFARTASG